MISSGLGMLAVAELMSWYNFVYPGSIFYYTAIGIKVTGFATMFVPFSKFRAAKGMAG
jgi:hypothetical protein